MKLTLFTAIILSLMYTAGAQATAIFQDDFDSEGDSGGSTLNYTGFSNWDVTDGTVDLINHNDYGIGCSGDTGKCVDMDGSTGNAGTLTSDVFTLAAGTYGLLFDIAGNQRGGADDSMEVMLGGFLTETFELSADAPWQTISRSFTVMEETTSYISFNHNGGDNIGIILDNVSVVPEPGTLALLSLGLLGLGAARRYKALV
ncbi:PEP-CTERM sorting domain-containing protein [Marinobacter zhanjiangensis]|uniref:Ice-binding protein C-terminal domain-containing protein n=1 Tax=Marinobacter zhanjiangensis TaxID=578215 RepID=A0ABQ3B586_9GAMM|nr:PEP-CTERM sorting domain-containing protein [Marinobacter zhanjiangensis]GGY80293.1 hypothetical protein GCM10007071_29520 [Marinobacter zhanjiangensis]